MSIYLAGHRGMVGSALLRKLKTQGKEVITADRIKLDLRRQNEVENFIAYHKPETVIIAAATVGGIEANSKRRAEFIYNNLAIETNIIEAAHKYKVKKLLFLGSSCIYPKHCPQPMKEEHLLLSPLEPTNEPYAIAKISGIKMCESYYRQYDSNFYSVMPTNLYGVNDRFDLDSSHVIPALIMKMHIAKTYSFNDIDIWGDGTALREFMYVDDLADACLYLLQNVDAKDIYSQGISHLNIGSGEEVSIRDLASKIKEVVGFKGSLTFDSSKPNGHPRKLLDTTRLKSYGFKPNFTLEEGLRLTYDYYLNDYNKSENRR